MIRPIITLRRRRILIDIDTQKDLFLADGIACIRNHRRVLANIRRIIAWARHKNIRTISTTCVGSGDDENHNYCIEGTIGQEKLSYTLRHRYISFPANGSTDLPRDILRNYDQVILQKRSLDPFMEARADRILSELKVDEFIVIGAVTEEAVKATVLGLLARRKNVTIFTDAVGSHNKSAAEIALRKMEAKGAKLMESKSLLGSTCLRLVGICDCDSCRDRMQKRYLKTGT